MRFTTTFTITSFSSVRLSAIIKVSATRVLSAMRLCPSSAYSTRLLFKNYRKSIAAMRLFPSLNEWFFTTRYSSMAAFSSTEG